MDIETLSMEELLELNRKIVARVNELSQRKRSELLQQFRIGDKVSFKSEGNFIEGEIVKIHKRNITVRTSHCEWVVPPQSLKIVPQSVPVWKKIFGK